MDFEKILWNSLWTSMEHDACGHFKMLSNVYYDKKYRFGCSEEAYNFLFSKMIFIPSFT